MKNIYLLGHGFIHLGYFINLPCSLTTYIPQNKMLDGRGLHSLVDNGKYTPPGMKGVQVHTAQANQTIKEHFLCSDISSFQDINKTEKWKKKPAGFRQNLQPGQGSVFFLDENTYLYMTESHTLTALASIIEFLKSHFGNMNFNLHWGACRTYVGGLTPEQIRQECTSDLAQPKKVVMTNFATYIRSAVLE